MGRGSTPSVGARAFPAAAHSGDSTYSDLRLALADLFWLYGIEHAGVRDDALRLVSSGADIETKRALGMSAATSPVGQKSFDD